MGRNGEPPVVDESILLQWMQKAQQNGGEVPAAAMKRQQEEAAQQSQKKIIIAGAVGEILSDGRKRDSVDAGAADRAYSASLNAPKKQIQKKGFLEELLGW